MGKDIGWRQYEHWNKELFNLERQSTVMIAFNMEVCLLDIPRTSFGGVDGRIGNEVILASLNFRLNPIDGTEYH
jgi:hypothetical protein